MSTFGGGEHQLPDLQEKDAHAPPRSSLRACRTRVYVCFNIHCIFAFKGKTEEKNGNIVNKKV